MINKLYVGNLQWGITEQDLREYFSQYGKVINAVIVLDRETGRSRGFGFVEMSTPEEAKQLMQSRSRPVIVAEALNTDPEGAPVDWTLSCYAAARVPFVLES